MNSHSTSSSLGTPCLTKNVETSQQSIKMREQRVVRTASIHAILLDPPFLFYKIRDKEDEVGGGSWELGVVVMSSFYLPDEFFFPSELRRHSEMTLHHGVSPLANENVQQNHLHDNKLKKTIRSEHIIFQPTDSS